MLQLSIPSFLLWVLCGDEKLFRLKGGFVRKVPNNPAKVGISHYQVTVMLSNGEPFLVYTRVHDTASNMEEITQTASIVLKRADLVQEFNQPTVICLDSYYLDALPRDTKMAVENILGLSVHFGADEHMEREEGSIEIACW